MSRSEAQIVVDCDRCGRETLTIPVVALAAVAWNLDIILEKYGWSRKYATARATDPSQDDYCPTCTEAIEADKERRAV